MRSRSSVALVPWLGKDVKQTDHTTDPYNGHQWCLAHILFSRPVHHFPGCREQWWLRTHNCPLLQRIALGLMEPSGKEDYTLPHHLQAAQSHDRLLQEKYKWQVPCLKAQQTVWSSQAAELPVGSS